PANPHRRSVARPRWPVGAPFRLAQLVRRPRAVGAPPVLRLRVRSEGLGPQRDIEPTASAPALVLRPATGGRRCPPTLPKAPGRARRRVWCTGSRTARCSRRGAKLLGFRRLSATRPTSLPLRASTRAAREQS